MYGYVRNIKFSYDTKILWNKAKLYESIIGPYYQVYIRFSDL